MFYCEAGLYDTASGTWLRPDQLGNTLEESPFQSIPAGMYWATVTLTTVGYGDMVSEA